MKLKELFSVFMDYTNTELYKEFKTHIFVGVHGIILNDKYCMVRAQIYKSSTGTNQVGFEKSDLSTEGLQGVNFPDPNLIFVFDAASGKYCDTCFSVDALQYLQGTDKDISIDSYDLGLLVQDNFNCLENKEITQESIDAAISQLQHSDKSKKRHAMKEALK